ncbi:UDP-glycosyltransferase 92A1-like [Hibiscus syriacus]|nr:UDP-glycosyltransferase 92A1-like [Hibiscus syriacus]
MDPNDEQKIDIVMLPFMAHGHLIPFLALANQIHHLTGFNIAIANTPLNIHYLHQQNSPPWIHLLELPFNGADHGLPPGTEHTENLSLNQIGKLIISSASLKTPLHDLLLGIIKKQGKPPLCIISDFLLGWAVDVADATNTVNIVFATGGAYGTLAYVSFWLNLPHRKTDDEEFNLPGFPQRCKFHVTQLHGLMRKADGNDPLSMCMQPRLSCCLQSFGWLCYTVEEIEPFGLDLLRKYTNSPVWPIGPLLPKQLLNNLQSSSTVQRVRKSPRISPEKCVQWLDMHGRDSVLYISFGSQNTISASNMMDLAIGLENSGKPFIWVIRPPLGHDPKAEFESEWLPQGFEDRMNRNNRGLLVKNWAPQLEILSHESTGTFLSHCGWNSTMESLSQGVKIIGWPIAAEQGYNSKMLVEEMGVAVELTRGVQNSISSKHVKEVIEMVMEKEGKGGDMKRKAEEIAQHIRAAVKDEGNEKGSSIKALDDFVSAITATKQDRSVVSA